MSKLELVVRILQGQGFEGSAYWLGSKTTKPCLTGRPVGPSHIVHAEYRLRTNRRKLNIWWGWMGSKLREGVVIRPSCSRQASILWTNKGLKSSTEI